MLGSLLFALAGTALIIFAETFTSNGGSVTFNTILGGLILAFFAYSFIMNLKRIIKKVPAYTISESGLIYDPEKPADCIVPWKDVKSFTRVKVKSHYYIILNIKNPDALIEKEQSSMKKRLMKMNLKNYGSPVSINMNELHISVVDFESLISSYVKRNK